MVKKISRYEIHQIEVFELDLKKEYKIKFQREEYMNEVWIAYLEMRRKYKYTISDSFYWKIVETCLLHHFEKLKKERNARFNQYNTKSLNKTYDGFREELGAYCCAGNGDFVNMIAIRDYAKKLGTVKYAIIRLLSSGGDDDYIMKRLKLEEEQYFKLKEELKEDFFRYISI